MRVATVAILVAAAWSAGGLYADDAGKVELPIELPEPYFGGTPLDYFGPNLEEPNYKPRPPFLVPEGTENVAAGKTVTASSEPEFGELGMLVDGDKSYKDESLLGLDRGHQWIQIDLGGMYEIYAILLWHFHQGDRVYFDVAIQVADDAAFTKNVRTIFNNDHDDTAGMGAGADKEYIESYKGKFIDTGGVKARAVRFFSKGNTTDDFNHYVEAEVFGKPAE
jgi:hypothetical protein